MQILRKLGILLVSVLVLGYFLIRSLLGKPLRTQEETGLDQDAPTRQGSVHDGHDRREEDGEGHDAVEAACRAWLSILYRDRPQEIDALLSAMKAALAQDDETLLSPDNVINFSAVQALDDAHAFAVDWKDGESFVDFVAAMAERFGFAIEWSEQNLEEDFPDELMQVAYPQFLRHGAVLYNAETGGDFYYLMVVPHADRADFETAAQAWGLAVRTADQPF